MTEQVDERCSSCGAPVGYINGRTLNESLRKTGITWPNGPVSNTEWVTICPICNAYVLRADSDAQPSFLAYDGAMRTFDDIDFATGFTQTPAINFHGFRFSLNALTSAARIADQDGLTTDAMQQAKVIAERLKRDPHTEDALDFSEAVCKWGRGRRVWSKMNRYNSRETLANSLTEWFVLASEADSPEGAIKPGVAIKGLGVSFASKHLRILWPEHYGVLDEVISNGLGFARSVTGYGLFMNCLYDFINETCLDQSVAEAEQGLFLLVRQRVRAQ